MCKLIPLLLCVAPGFAQLTQDQRISDFLFLAGLYAKNYAPYEWKRETQNFDLLNSSPWLERARDAKTDLEFYEVMVEYVASLNDAHDTYQLPSNFVARLNFGVDIYDGKPLVEFINRTRLPAAEFPVQIGYELVSIDGVSVEDLVKQFSKYAVGANPRSTRRFAANLLTIRPQSIMPHAVDVGDIARVVFRRPSGETESYAIPWTKTGLPLRNMGPVPTPARRASRAEPRGWEEFLHGLQRVEVEPRTVLGYGARSPIFGLPEGFQQRLGRAGTDFFFSGTFQAGGFRIGYFRIPTFSPPSLQLAAQQMLGEVTFLEANTDGLIVDIMRNPGGFVDATNLFLQLLIPTRLQTVGFEIRATSSFVRGASIALEQARAQGAPDWVISLITELKRQVEEANASNRGRTGPLPLDDFTIEREPITDQRGRPLAYTKPLILLVDELSASGGDVFAASIQDHQRGPLFGYRTMGAGGSVYATFAGPYSEGFTSITDTLMSRKNEVAIAGYPLTRQIENVGVHPDIQADYMTRDNLMQNGKPFVDSFLAAMVEHIRRSRQ